MNSTRTVRDPALVRPRLLAPGVALALGLALALPPVAVAADPVAMPSVQTVTATTRAGDTPAERAIAEAERRVERDPTATRALADLALAQSRRARETGDPAWYDRAAATVERALEIDGDDYAARRAQVWILLGRHRFEEALAEATALQERSRDDLMLYGFLVDANAELGDYAAAEEAAQWMLDLRPGNPAGLSRAAYLRELFGYLDGSLDLLMRTWDRTRPEETEDRAWLLTQMAHVERLRGKWEEADALLDRALELFPGYHYALAGQGRLRLDQGRPAEAAERFRARWKTAPHPENLYELGDALAAAGHDAEAGRAFARFERQARAEMRGPDNANRELVDYYLKHADAPERALEVATIEFERRRDVFTLTAYARALAAVGRIAEARRWIDAALDVGVRDPRILRHAEAIRAQAGSS